MLTETQRREWIGNIERLPQDLEAAVDGLDDHQLDTPYREGGWTVRQVVHHLADSHTNALIRMKLLLTEDYPTIKPYDQDQWAMLDDAKLPVDPSIMILKGLHDRWTALLRSLPGEAWERRGMHPENGEMSLDDFLRSYGNHGAHHVGQITRLRQERGW